jgi:hypothetical protein
MGGGGGGGGYFPRPRADLKDLFRETQERAHQDQLDAEINRLLRDLNSTFERDAELIRDRLDALATVLQDRGDMEKFLFGGSVAKHTFVDGLSDVDALVILKDESPLAEVRPAAVLERFATLLRTRLDASDVAGVSVGQMAVTVTYRDGSEIQLLPAIREGEAVCIPPSKGTEWRAVRPRAFQQVLSSVNRDLAGTLVPTIKLLKSLNSGLPEQKQLIGYHIEALSIEAARTFKGTPRMKDVVLHVLGHAAKRVLNPIRDMTGQSHNVDDYLGDAHSSARRIAADGLNALVRRLSTAKTAEEWRNVLES